MPAERRLASPEDSALVMAMATAIGNHVFAGKRPEYIAACLAELMSTLLLNHRIPADRTAEQKLREEILTEWCVQVRQLVALEIDPPATETMQ